MELLTKLRDEAIPLDIIIGYLVIELEDLEKVVKEKDDAIRSLLMELHNVNADLHGFPYIENEGQMDYEYPDRTDHEAWLRTLNTLNGNVVPQEQQEMIHINNPAYNPGTEVDPEADVYTPSQIEATFPYLGLG